MRIEESCEISSECEKFEPHLFSDWRNFRLMKVAFDQISDFKRFVSADYSNNSSCGAVADPRFIGPIDRHIVNNSHIFSEIFQKYL